MDFSRDDACWYRTSCGSESPEIVEIRGARVVNLISLSHAPEHQHGARCVAVDHRVRSAAGWNVSGLEFSPVLTIPAPCVAISRYAKAGRATAEQDYR